MASRQSTVQEASPKKEKEKPAEERPSENREELTPHVVTHLDDWYDQLLPTGTSAPPSKELSKVGSIGPTTLPSDDRHGNYLLNSTHSSSSSFPNGWCHLSRRTDIYRRIEKLARIEQAGKSFLWTSALHFFTTAIRHFFVAGLVVWRIGDWGVRWLWWNRGEDHLRHPQSVHGVKVLVSMWKNGDNINFGFVMIEKMVEDQQVELVNLEKEREKMENGLQYRRIW